MIDHMTIRVADIERTKSFYEKALAPLGYALAFDETFSDGRVIGFRRNGRIDTWFTPDRPTSGPVHIAWSAATRADVDAFHRVALAAGGRDHGAPGLRPHYHADYYGAFILDPDGNNVEAVCREPA